MHILLRYEFRASSVFFVKRFGLLLICWLLFDGFTAQAQGQPCRNRIENNTFTIEPGVCENTVAILRGSTPTGGNRNYIYQWEFASGNCGQNSFVPIPFANGKDYIVPANADQQICYRRVVISGLCVDRSNASKVQGENRKPAAAPLTTLVQPNCDNLKGSIKITHPAPAAGLTYSIDGTTYTNTSGEFTDLDPGIYQVSVKHSSGCISPVNIDTIVGFQIPTGSISPATATLCPGTSLTLTVSGGTAYQWYRNGQKIEGATQATYTASQPGEYTADIRNGDCQGKSSNTAVVSAGSPITFELTVTDPNCTNSKGIITIQNPSGGSGTNYQYSKDNGTTFQTSNTFNDLVPGTYTILVKDGAGCESSSKVAIVKTFTPTLKINTSVINIACNQRLGIISVFATGGTAPYQFSINGGSGQNLNVFSGLSAGTYTLTVTDANGCRETVSATISITNSTLTAKAVVTDATCKEKATVNIEATGGVPPYQFNLDGGSFQASPTFSNLPGGTRKITVRDSLGCEFEISFTVKDVSPDPVLVINNPARICPGTSTSLQSPAITTGSDPDLVFSYWRDTAATLAVSNPAAVQPGTYFIKATNRNGCFTIKPVTITPLPTQAGNILIQGPPLVCNGRSVNLTASEGTAYQWYRNDTAINGATGRSYTATIGGNYSVMIQNGTCTVRAYNTAQIQFQECISTPETKVFVPTAFTPNRNNENDLLRPVLYNMASLSYFKVYNRWGQLVFETNQAGRGWDGTIKGVPQPTETYSWILQCTDNNGNLIKKSGRSLLIR